jgi:hypothetical protein
METIVKNVKTLVIFLVPVPLVSTVLANIYHVCFTQEKLHVTATQLRLHLLLTIVSVQVIYIMMASPVNPSHQAQSIACIQLLIYATSAVTLH